MANQKTQDTCEYALSIKQPWASLIVHGLKTVEDGVMLRSQANLVAARKASWGKTELETARIILDRIRERMSK